MRCKIGGDSKDGERNEEEHRLPKPVLDSPHGAVTDVRLTTLNSTITRVGYPHSGASL